MRRAWLVLRALYELARYDAIVRLRGSGAVLGQLRRQSVAEGGDSGWEQAVSDATQLATCFYWKPVLCLQRAVVTARLLRQHGVAGRVAIGYRPAPFFSHAWVEVDGRVVYGSPAYQTRLRLLHVV